MARAKDITIEGNGAVLSYINKIYSESDAKERCGFHIDSGAKVEINDLTIEGNGKIKHGVNVYTSTGDEITTVKLNGVIMNDGTGYGLVNNSSNVTVTDIETSGNGWGGINVDNPPDAGKDGAEFEMISGTIGEKTSVKIENRANNTITAKINGGTFEGDVFIDDDVKKATLTITNGTFANDVTKYMDNGSKLLKDEEGNYVVMDDKAFEKSDKEFYISDEDDLKLAEKYQADGVTWVLAEGTYKVEETIKLNKNVIIEGNDSTIEYTKEIYNSTDRSERCGFNIDGGANVEISGLTIEGNKNIKHCINVYTGEGQKTTTVKLNGVIMKDGKEGYGLVNNASDVTVKNIETSGNDWRRSRKPLPERSPERR